MINEKFKDEVMSKEELDNVVGGGIGQTMGDERFLNKMGYLPATSTGPYFLFHWDTASKYVDGGWAKAGVTCVTTPDCRKDNQYFIGSKQISRKEAFRYVLRQKGYSEDAIAKYNYDQFPGEMPDSF